MLCAAEPHFVPSQKLENKGTNLPAFYTGLLDTPVHRKQTTF